MRWWDVWPLRQVSEVPISYSIYKIVNLFLNKGVTHTISAAVIAVELTNNLPMLMPCLLASVIASGITKHKGYSVYDRGMLNKGLDSLQLLLMGPVSLQQAKQVMDIDFSSIPLRSNLLDIMNIIAEVDQEVFPVVSSIDGKKKLEGTASRDDIYFAIKEVFIQYGKIIEIFLAYLVSSSFVFFLIKWFPPKNKDCEDSLRNLLKYDFMEDMRKIVRNRLLQKKKERRDRFWNSVCRMFNFKSEPKTNKVEKVDSVYRTVDSAEGATTNPIHILETRDTSTALKISELPLTYSIGGQFKRISQKFVENFVSASRERPR